MNIQLDHKTYATGEENRRASVIIRRKIWSAKKVEARPAGRVIMRLPDAAALPVSEPVVTRTFVPGAERPEWKTVETRFRHHVEEFEAHVFRKRIAPLKAYAYERAWEAGVDPEVLFSRTRKRPTVLLKHRIFYEIKTVIAPQTPLTVIGAIFGVDHTTVMHGVQKIQAMKDRGEID